MKLIKNLLITVAALMLFSAADGCNNGDDDDDNAGVDYEFSEYEWLAEKPDVTTDRLCLEAADPEAAADKVYINCRVEGASFAPAEVEPKDELRVMAYNLERGYHLDEIIDLLLADPGLPLPDVILISEADRGCARTDLRYILWDMAEALDMNFVFSTEFVELPRGDKSSDDVGALCEHGNGILSRYPLGNVRTIRYRQNLSWYLPPDQRDSGEPRLGGRNAVAADVMVGKKIARLYAVHFESSVFVILEQYKQARELVEDAADIDYPILIGGDMNTGFYYAQLTGAGKDKTVTALTDGGYIDSHDVLDPEVRPSEPGAPIPMILDLIFGRNVTFSNPGVCSFDICGGLSDHLPIWATISLTP